jgi:hypothetical protein
MYFMQFLPETLKIRDRLGCVYMDEGTILRRIFQMRCVWMYLEWTGMNSGSGSA